MSVLFALAAPAAEQVCATPAECADQGVGTFVGTPARIWAGVAALVGLVGVVIGWLALARSGRRIGNGWGKGALVLGLIAVAGGVLNLAVADGGPGTGNGVVGGAVAIVAGMVAVVVGGLAQARSRRAV